MKLENAQSPFLTFEEQAGDPAMPAAGLWIAYFKADGLYIQDEAGAVAGPFVPGSASTDPTYDALGDLVVGTGDNTAGRLPAGADGLSLLTDSGEATGLKWGTPAEPLVAIETEAGTAYTVVAADHGKVKRFTDAALVTVTLPDGLPTGTLVGLLFVGVAGGAVQDDGTSVVNGEGTVAQFGEASCLADAADNWNVQGTA